VAEGGTIVEEVGTGEMQVDACALGGPDGRTPYRVRRPVVRRARTAGHPGGRPAGRGGLKQLAANPAPSRVNMVALVHVAQASAE